MLSERASSEPNPVWSLLAVVAIVSLLLLDVPVCPTAVLFHFPCPGCGLTRASLRLLQGDLSGAWALHPFALVAAPILALFAVDAWLTRTPAGRGLLQRLPRAAQPLANGMGWLLIVGLLTLWVARFFGTHGGPVPV